ncbi:MAG TPA: alpha-L-rhamnosidase N-terminal domain-containing protein, partial [Acidimicrobiales bacterium]|nr:alpha-L-rhamnosidase N-terminal domain-containing protein [Acidimicrobiales bacterium]
MSSLSTVGPAAPEVVATMPPPPVDQEPPWSAHWIAVEPPPQGDPATAMFFGSGPAGFSRCMFRRAFEVGVVPSHAEARVSADSRYLLYVNGQVVGRGPARSQPSRQRYDSWHLGPYLHQGRNVVAALATYYDKPTSFWMPAPPGGVIGRDAVFIFEARLGPEVLITDEAWRAQRSTAWTLAAATFGLHGLPVEVFDQRLLPSGWHDEDFDDSDWDSATVMTAVHVGGLGRARPPVYPYGRLLPRGISPLTGGVVEARSLSVAHCATVDAADLHVAHPVERVRELWSAPGLSFDDATLPLTVDVGPDGASLLALDFGRVVAGFVEIDVEGPAGTVLDCYYRERIFHPESVTFSDPATGARFIAGGQAGTL